MGALKPLEAVSAYDLVELAWELACAEKVGVAIGETSTSRGSEPCVVAHIVPDARPFLIVPSPDGALELWWSQYDTAPALVGIVSNAHAIVETAHQTHFLLTAARAGR